MNQPSPTKEANAKPTLNVMDSRIDEVQNLETELKKQVQQTETKLTNMVDEALINLSSELTRLQQEQKTLSEKLTNADQSNEAITQSINDKFDGEVKALKQDLVKQKNQVEIKMKEMKLNSEIDFSNKPETSRKQTS